MKKVLSIILTIVMLSSVIGTVSFAETVSGPNVQNLTLSGKWSNTYQMTEEKGVYGKASDDTSVYVPLAGKKLHTLTLGETINTSVGDKILLSFSVARTKASTGSKRQLSVSVAGTTTDSALPLNTTNGDIRFLFDTGVLASQSNYIPSGYKKIPTPIENWTTYDIVYTVGETSNLYSVYVNGRPAFENKEFKTGTTIIPTIKTITAVNLYAREESVPTYFDDISISHYPAAIADTLTINMDPLTANNEIFTVAADDSLSISDVDIDADDIAALNLNGWNFEYIGSEDGSIGESGYLKMSKGDTVYYKKVSSSLYEDLIAIDFSSVRDITKDWFWHPVRRIGKTGSNFYQVKGYDGKSSDNGSVYLEYTNSDASPAAGQLNGFHATAVTADANPHNKMIKTGRMSYEASVLIPYRATRIFIFEVYYNGTLKADGSATENSLISQPFSVEPDGTVVFGEGYTVEDEFKNYHISFGEWYRLNAIFDTDKDEAEFYINGKKAASCKLDNLIGLNHFQAGFSTRGNASTANDKFSFVFDDVRIRKLRSTAIYPEAFDLVSGSDAVTIDNANGLIKGAIESTESFESVVTVPGSHVFYSDKALVNKAPDGQIGKYLVVKNSDETIVRKYALSSYDLDITGFDVSSIGGTATGSKKITVSIENMKTPFGAMIVLASYNNGQLIALDKMTKAAEFKGITTYEVSIEVKEDEPVDEIKAFAWIASTLTPLASAVSTKNN